MGLSDDFPADELKSTKQNEAEQLAGAVADATENGDVEAAVSAVSDLLEALYRLDDSGFGGAEGRGKAEPSFHAHTDWATIDIGPNDYEGGGEIDLATVAGQVSFWTPVPDVEGASVAFYLSPSSAMWLAEQLPKFAARAQTGAQWEDLGGAYDE